MPSFIPDGYTFRAVVNPKEYVHDGLVFSYRPVTPNESAEYHSHDVKGLMLREVQIKLILKKVLSWSLPNGGDIPEMTAEVLGEKLHNELFSKMFGIVMGWDIPDSGERCDKKEMEKN